MRLLMGIVAIFLAMVSGVSYAQEVDPGKQMLEQVKSRIKTISTADLKKMIDDKEDFILLDVREANLIDSMGWIDAPQQLVIDRGWIESRIFNELDHKNPKDMNKPIVAYCGGGIRSAFAADTLQQLGFKNVYNYEAGFLDWEAQGLPVKYKETDKK